MDKIMGHDWRDIQRAQQGGTLARPIVRTEPAGPTADDRALLAQHGSLDALRAAGLHGVVDRLSVAAPLRRRVATCPVCDDSACETNGPECGK